jgi:2-amino-4-hydroxy-6-hydroxymethyldihydropteridine diphosphokinase
MLLLGPHGEVVMVTSDLVVPHPRLHERAFALRPVLDLAPSLVHPALGVPLSDLLASLPRVDHQTQPIGWL